MTIMIAIIITTMKNIIKIQEVITAEVAIMIIIKVLVMIIVIGVVIEVMFYLLQQN